MERAGSELRLWSRQSVRVDPQSLMFLPPHQSRCCIVGIQRFLWLNVLREIFRCGGVRAQTNTFSASSGMLRLSSCLPQSVCQTSG